MSKTFDYHAYQVWVNKLEKITQTDFDKFLEGFLLQMGYRVIARTKPRTPVKTGFLKASWKVDKVEKIGRTFRVTISNNTEYASYIEYGHHSYPAKYMVTISIDEIAQQIPARFDKEFKKWIAQKGVG